MNDKNLYVGIFVRAIFIYIKASKRQLSFFAFVLQIS